MQRIPGFDVVRVIALACIMLCHYFGVQGGAVAETCHDVLGVLGNALFFVLSGCCLGLRYEIDGRPHYGAIFLRRRLLRLYKPFIVFIAFYVILLCAAGKVPSIGKVLMNFANWVAD